MLSPFLLCVVCAIKVTSHGKVIFSQRRMGKNQKLFLIYKFRTMSDEYHEYDTNNVIIYDDDPRLTRIGAFLRKTKIDELPQLFNILKGDMSFVGHRPLVEDFSEHYEAWELKKFDMKPGLTGYAQVNGNGYLDRKSRSYYDVYYLSKVSAWFDVKIFLKTFIVVVSGERKYLTQVSDYRIEDMLRETKIYS